MNKELLIKELKKLDKVLNSDSFYYGEFCIIDSDNSEDAIELSQMDELSLHEINECGTICCLVGGLALLHKRRICKRV